MIMKFEKMLLIPLLKHQKTIVKNLTLMILVLHIFVKYMVKILLRVQEEMRNLILRINF